MQNSELVWLYALAVMVSTLTTWLLLRSIQTLATSDTTGNAEVLLPLLRLGVVAAPLIVALRAAAHATIAWCVLALFESRIGIRVILRAALFAAPILEISPMADAIGTLLSTSGSGAGVHLPMAIDALLPELSGSMLIVARSIGIPLICWGVFFMYLIRQKAVVRHTALYSATVATAAFIVVLPVLSGAS